MSQDPNKPKNDEQELSVDDLESVTGGASDYLLELDGIKGESSDKKGRTRGHTVTIKQNG